MRCGHRQTIVGSVFLSRRFPYHAVSRTLELPDGDVLVVHDDVPDTWQPTDPVALLVHGLGGDYQSGYMVRVAAKLKQQGIRVFRMDQRGCGAAQWLSRETAHAGRSDDVAVVLDWARTSCPDSALTLIGFSLGGNAVLKLAGEQGHALAAKVQSLIAIAPPIDLEYCARNLTRPQRRFYDRRFVRRLCRQVRAREQRVPAARGLPAGARPGSVLEFDECYTAPMGGFQGSGDYYARSSAGSLLANIQVPTRILVAEDDPVVPGELFTDLQGTDFLQILRTQHGGHLGYLGTGGLDPDRRWMDWRIVEWVQSDVEKT